MYYECHITMLPHTTRSAQECEEAVKQLGWSYSCIHGDPMLGKHPFRYATQHFDSDVQVIIVMNHLTEAAQSLRNQGWTVVREKIELVLLDSKH